MESIATVSLKLFIPKNFEKIGIILAVLLTFLVHHLLEKFLYKDLNFTPNNKILFKNILDKNLKIQSKQMYKMKYRHLVGKRYYAIPRVTNVGITFFSSIYAFQGP